VLTREAMDGLSQSLAPRMAVDKKALGEDPSLLDRLMDHEVGDVIPVTGDPSKVFMPLVTPDMSASALQAIEYWDRRSEEASGVNRHAMGIQPQAITDTKGGIENLQAAANSRIEQYARWAALAIETALNKALRLIVRHQDQARIVKVNGRRLEIDPRRWSDDMTVRVHVGMAAESREKRLAYLGAIAGKQEQILMQLSPSNPLVSLKHYRKTLAKMITTMGERDPSAFVGEIPDNWQPPQQEDPKAAEAKAKLQMAQAEMAAKQQLSQAQAQQTAQLEQAKAQAVAQRSEAELAHKQRLAEVQFQHDSQLAEAKAASERQLAQIKIEAEAQIARERAAAEMELARERQAMEMELAQFKAAQDVKLRRSAAARGGMNGSGDGIDQVNFGGAVG
jgi:hypothetical protein